jgi:hypothetical protein
MSLGIKLHLIEDPGCKWRLPVSQKDKIKPVPEAFSLVRKVELIVALFADWQVKGSRRKIVGP